MIYVDTSVVLAQLLAEDRVPKETLWRETLITSRLLHYEVWVRVNERALGASHGEAVRATLARIAVVEMHPLVLQRAIEPFPVRVRTLDAIHLASALFLRANGQAVALASYDERMLAGARALGIPSFEV